MAARACSSKATAEHLGTVCDRRHSGRNKQHCHVVLALRFGPVIHTHTHRRKQVSLLDSQPAANACSCLGL